ncbi:hypothetical protein AOY93_11955 [Escherichia coli]|nr:hypothetical protein AOY93_11955 [Escherichia coli]
MVGRYRFEFILIILILCALICRPFLSFLTVVI